MHPPAIHLPSSLTLATSILSIPSFILHFISSSSLRVRLDSAALATGRDGGPRTSPTLERGAARAERVRAHKAAAAERNKGGVLHHSNRGHSDSCLRHAHTDKRPEKQMVRAFMTSLVEAQESPLFKGGFFFCQPFHNKAPQSGRKLEMHFQIVT